MDVDDLPYRAEYAKSGRASCKGCKTPIAKEILRMAVMIKSPMFDGKVPHWYHMTCFFAKQRPKTIGDIAHVESLRYEDQQKIKEKIESGPATPIPTGKKGKKRGANVAAADSGNSNLKDYVTEYSKSSRAVCRGCEQKIMKDNIRISKKDFETDVGKRYGGQDMWHHLECFEKLRTSLTFFDCGDKLPGFGTLSAEDKKKVKDALPAVKQEDIPVKKAKTEDEVDGAGRKVQDEIKKQTKLIFKYRDSLKNLKKKDLQLLLEHNDQEVPVGVDTMLDRLSDAMAFGCLEPCKTCAGGQLVFHKTGYVCQGDLTEWTKCQHLYLDPKRKKFKVPEELKEEHAFLNKYKSSVLKRTVQYVPPSVSAAVKKEEEDATDSKPRVERAKPALYNMQFVVTGFPQEKRIALEKAILQLGGRTHSAIKKQLVMALVSTPKEVEKLSKKVQEAMELDVHVVSEDFVDAASHCASPADIPDLVRKHTICTWGSDPSQRIPEEKIEKSKSKSGSMYTKSVPDKVRMRVKGGGAVDPDSGLEDVAHVYQDGRNKYDAVLGLTDLQKQKNSYYKIQLLEADKKQKYWVFRSWGRIATTVGGNKLETMDSLYEARSHFESLYEEKTGNMWSNREHFVKVPGRMYPIDVDYSHQDNVVNISGKDDKSKLQPAVQDLIRLIFDVNSMKKVMLEYELDMTKMPLGKLSKKQIQSAFSILSELQALAGQTGTERRQLDASNRFYTFIPHSFGMDNPPVINTVEMVKEKLEMLDSLLELEIAYNLMKDGVVTEGESPIDSHYERLKCNLEPVAKQSDQFALLREYVRNTHAETHSQYDLEIAEVFEVKRSGEEKRFKPFRKLPNRKLLWHGSRTTNYAGILSQGLRIAPPEAPVAGYMFGKGIYFADMVSKSANYCCTNYTDSTGLLLLCEVALGDMYERNQADFIEKLPKGKHSTKGVGMTQPQPDKSVFKDGVEIPLGKGVKVPGVKSSLLYNEYIVYDVAQVNIKYLVKMDFKYKI